ncbi:MAG: rod shape-determining protein MreC [Terriglobales bacterium]|jgi:rod shape-determining protein MreC
MDVLGRYRNLIVLVGVLFAQILGLAVQVRRTTDNEPTRLIRIWAVDVITPLEKVLVWVETSTSNVWHSYFYLRGVRAENRSLKQQIERMSLEQVRISQDADQARRLQALLAFKEQFISHTMAAQVIGSSGSELSRSVYIDKGEGDGIKPDMAVITADGIVGKVLRVYGSTSLVLLINDQTSGVGALLDKTRLQGILRGTPSGEVVLEKVMSDETVPVGEMVLTSGGDGIFPKGLLVGRVTKAAPGSDLFLNIRVRPAADLSKLEEVLVVTKIDERQAEPDQTGATRAVDILAERLPGVPAKPEDGVKAGVAGTGAAATATTGSEGKPKAALPPVAAGSAVPAARKTAGPIPSPSNPSVPSAGAGSGTSSATNSATKAATTAVDASAGAGATKVSPKPVKEAADPKPQPDVENSPH